MRVVIAWCILVLCLVGLSGCAQPKAGSVSTIPWDERAEVDGLTQQYSFFEDDDVYSGRLTNLQDP